MRKGVVIGVISSLVVMICVIAAFEIVKMDGQIKKNHQTLEMMELQGHMMKLICEDGYSDILVDYHKNNLERNCKQFITQYDDLILTMNVEDERSFLAKHYEDMVKRYDDFYNATILRNTVKFDKDIDGDHVVFGGGKFTEQEKVFKLSRTAREYVLDHYDKYVKSNQE